METYILSKEDRDALLKYLVNRPYGEVSSAISVLMRLPKLDPKINPSFVQDNDNANKKKA
jgi:hypothetical protein|tara:strand:+ start:337 stop:516 length:180 start_codon:yes stop_codon:yes gene_type:complete